jgi:hypothetical protein
MNAFRRSYALREDLRIAAQVTFECVDAFWLALNEKERSCEDDYRD